MRDWPLIGRRWRERECITCYLIPRGRIFDRLHAWHMGHIDGVRYVSLRWGAQRTLDFPGPAPGREAGGIKSNGRAGEGTEDDEWVGELHAWNQLGKMGDLTRPIADQTFYEIEAVIRQLRIPDWLPERIAA